jgi:hypothetical protein
MLVQDIQRSNAKVRSELYAVYAEIYLEKESHVAALTKSQDGHSRPCEWCDRFDQRMVGVKMALRRFGGNPRVIPKKCFEIVAARRTAGAAAIVPWPKSSGS